MVVHPFMTTRALTNDRIAAADSALALLEHMNWLIDPVTAGLNHAFSFSQQSDGVGKRKLNKRQLAKTSEDNVQSASDLYANPEFINLELAHGDSLFKNAEDFWHIVGWAFNCSIEHKQRWARWAIWLNYHLDVIENDWRIRTNQLKPTSTTSDQQAAEALPEESIIMRYLQPLGAGASRTARRRAMRAIFACASTKDLTEFPEVFRNELKDRRKEQTAEESRQRQRVNIDEGNFGDYFDEDDDELDPSAATDGAPGFAGNRRATRRTKNNEPVPHVEADLSEKELMPDETTLLDTWGGAAVLQLRQRLLVTLTQVSLHLPEKFVHLAELLDIYTEFMRPLPVPVFAELMSPSSALTKKASYSAEIYSSLVQMLLHALAGSAKAPKVQLLKIPTQQDIQRTYLSCASSSSTPADNAKISLLLEGILRILMQQSQAIQAGQGFKADLEWGIEVRRAKAANMFSTAKTMRVRNEDEEAHQWLASSEARLALMADILEGAGSPST